MTVHYDFNDKEGYECDIKTWEDDTTNYIQIRSHGKERPKTRIGKRGGKGASVSKWDQYAGVVMEFDDRVLMNRFINRTLRFSGYRVPNLFHKSAGGRTTDHKIRRDATHTMKESSKWTGKLKK